MQMRLPIVRTQLCGALVRKEGLWMALEALEGDSKIEMQGVILWEKIRCTLEGEKGLLGFPLSGMKKSEPLESDKIVRGFTEQGFTKMLRLRVTRGVGGEKDLTQIL